MTLSTVQELPNRVNTAGATAVRGSTTGVDTNDYVSLDHNGTHYVYGPGTGDNGLTVPSLGDMTGVAVTTFTLGRTEATTTGGSQYYLDVTGSNNGRYQCYATASAALVLATEASGGAGAVLSVALVDADIKPWLKWEVTWATNTLEVFYSDQTVTSPSDVAWVSAGTDVHGVALRVPTASPTTALYRVSAPRNDCMIRSVLQYDGVDEVDINPAADIDTTSDPDAGQASFTATTGQTVTVVRAATGLHTAVVTRNVGLFDGADDYMQLDASLTPTFTAASGKYTGIVAYRRHGGAPAAPMQLLDTRSNISTGMELHALNGGTTLRVVVRGATTSAAVSTPSLTFGSLAVAAVVIDDGTAYIYDDVNGLSAGVSIAGVGALGFNAPRVGSTAYAVSQLGDNEIFHVAIFDGEALTETQLNTLATKLISGEYS